jgi:hypothetical protein
MAIVPKPKPEIHATGKRNLYMKVRLDDSVLVISEFGQKQRAKTVD